MPEALTASIARRRFFATDSATLARRLLGHRLVRVLDDGTRLAGIIVEVEAYAGVADAASHAYKGRRTPRNESMYGPPGTAYVYFTYGMHFCFNVVCGREGEPLAVLIRALEPVEGLGRMRANRAAGGRDVPDRALCRGPGCVCKALEIDRELDGIDLAARGALYIERTSRGVLSDELVAGSPRIGIGEKGRWTGARLRWFVKGNDCVSATRASGRKIKPARSARMIAGA